MKRPRLTVRVRLTLLYTGLFAFCGAILVTITYVLVANLSMVDEPSMIHVDNPADFLAYCRQALQADASEELRYKCDRAFQEGVIAGAQTQQDATMAHLLQYSVITLVAVTLVAALAGWIVAGRVLRPVHQITAAARNASEHNLSERVALTGPRDELRELADTFDGMLGRLQSSFTSQRRFIANASHELRTPLTVMGAAVDVVMAKPSPTQAELLTMGRDVRAAVDQAEAVVAALLTLARNDHGLRVREEVDLATVAEDVLDAADVGDRRLHVALQPAVTSGDAVLLERLVANLAGNAIRYNVPGGDVWLTTEAPDRTLSELPAARASAPGSGSGEPSPADQVTLTVANTGPVIPPERIGDLFEPFQRLQDRTAGDGLGLGLALVSSIAAVHGGTVAAEPRPGGGLRVTVSLPAV